MSEQITLELTHDEVLAARTCIQAATTDVDDVIRSALPGRVSSWDDPYPVSMSRSCWVRLLAKLDQFDDSLDNELSEPSPVDDAELRRGWVDAYNNAVNRGALREAAKRQANEFVEAYQQRWGD